MDLIKTEYIKEYQKEYQIEYYKNNREDIAEKNKIYYEIHKEKKEKIIKEKVVIINFDLIKVEQKFIRLFFD